MKKLLQLLLGFSFLIFGALSSTALAESSKSSILKSLEDLDSAANFLMQVADEKLVGDPGCKLTSAEAFKLLNSLHAKIDAKKSLFLAARKKEKAISDTSWAKNCEAQCNCGLYASTLEMLGFEQLGEADQKAYRQLSNLAMNQTSESLLACAKSRKNFCSSALLKQLKKETK